jgi:hypothetical protein
MATTPNTNINIPYSSFLDESTGRPSQAWLLWLMSPSFITINISNALPVTSGGTGLSTIPTNGQLLIGNGTGYSLNTLGAGTGISVTNGSGTITVANTGVLSNIAGNGISVSNATGNVTIANTGVLSFSGGTTGFTPATPTTGAVTLDGTLGITNGGTNGSATPTAYGVAYGTGTAYAFTAAGTTKQALLANTGAAPTWSTLTSGSSILYGDGSGGFSNVTIGTGISFVAGTLSATGSGGTVTSVTGTSPVVSSGGTIGTMTFAAALGDTVKLYASETAINDLAAPNGSAGVPTFRALVAADIPTLSYVTSVSGTTGRITSTGGTTPVIDLASGIASAGTTGSSTLIPVVTIDTYGRVTSISTASNPQGTVTSVTGTSPVVSSGGATPAISIPAATTSVSGYLTSTDWNTFNGKQAAGTYVNSVSGTTGRITSTGGVTPVIDLASGVATAGTTGSSTLIPVVTIDTYGRVTSISTASNPQGTVTSVAALTLGTTGTDLSSSVATGTTTPVITLNVPTASATNRGALSAADWTTFNGKGSGTVTSVSFTGGIITVATGTTTPAFTVAGTSGGIPYFSSGTTWASSAALTQYGVVYGGGAGASPVATAAGTTGQVLTATTSGAPTWANPATSGTVTSVSVVSANGFAGTVATATTTPAITLTTSITGVLKGNGTAISAAVANTDYFAPSAPVTKTADFTVAATDVWLINNKAGSTCTVTLPAASSWTGRVLRFLNYQVRTVVSASSNVVPLIGGSAGTSILLASSGDSATLVSDGTNWLITQYIPNNILLLE